MTKDEKWMQERCGRITASELSDIVSASGKIIDTNINYIRAKRWERQHGYSLPVSSKIMDIGNENEPMIYQWLLANYDGAYSDSVLYSKDCYDIPFWSPEDMPFFGASPDAFSIDGETIFEFKTLVGNESTCFFMDEFTSNVEKKARVLKEHGDQLMGLFLSKPSAKRIVLVKYAYQRDDIPFDRDSPLEPWRGITFSFDREDYAISIEQMKKRIILFNAMIDAQVNPAEFKVGSWFIKDGELVKE